MTSDPAGNETAGGGPASGDGPGGDPAPQQEADRMARRLIGDVAAYEVDPPAPARVESGGDEPEAPGTEAGE